MELQTIKQVSSVYGVSRRMLCYYEEIGLIKSSRIDNYAYRVYDEAAIRRLQQIIILRKLQIPMKQISNILNNQNAVEVIEIFKQNISELDEQITSLSTVKSILTHFIDELQEKADIRLRLDLLQDTSMIAAIKALSFSDNKIKESVSMEELNKASEALDKEKEKAVRVVYYPTETTAMLRCETAWGPLNANEEATIKKFIHDTNLIKIKPDFKIIGCHNDFYVTVPEDLEIPEPFVKTILHGGLYAAITVTPQNKYDWQMFDIWLKDNEDYINDQGAANENSIPRGSQEIFFNPLNIFGLKNTDIFNSVLNPDYYDLLCPIREKERMTDEKLDALRKWEAVAAHKESVEIDLKTLKQNGEGKVDLKYLHNIMTMKSDDNYSWGMETQQTFNCPMKVYMRAKTDSTDLCIGTFAGLLNINAGDFGKPMVLFGGDKIYPWSGKNYPIDKFIDIEWILGTDIMAIKIDGELRVIGDEFGYIQSLRNNLHECAGPIRVATCRGATVTVEKLCVTEL